MDSLRQVSRSIKETRAGTDHAIRRATENKPVIDRVSDFISPTFPFEMDFQTYHPDNEVTLDLKIKDRVIGLPLPCNTCNEPPGDEGCTDEICGITDTFTRTLSGTLGTSDYGTNWVTLTGSPSVNGSEASLPAATHVFLDSIPQVGNATYSFVWIPGSTGLFSSAPSSNTSITLSKTSNNVTIDRDDGVNQDSDVQSFTFTAGVRYSVRVYDDIDVTRVKVWEESSTEPASWLVEVTITYSDYGEASYGFLASTVTQNFDNLNIEGVNKCTGVQFETFDRTDFATWNTLLGAGPTTPSNLIWNGPAPGGSDTDIVSGKGHLAQTGTGTSIGDSFWWITTANERWAGDFSFTTKFTIVSQPPSTTARPVNDHRPTVVSMGVSTSLGATHNLVTVGFALADEFFPGQYLFFNNTKVAKTWATGQTYNLRWNRTGAQNQVRVWQGTEPTTWDIDTTADTDPGVGFSILGSTARKQFISDPVTSYEVAFDFMEFDYANKPCYISCIDGVYNLIDTFTRNETGTWGTSEIDSLGWSTSNAAFTVNGSEGVVVGNISNSLDLADASVILIQMPIEVFFKVRMTEGTYGPVPQGNKAGIILYLNRDSPTDNQPSFAGGIVVNGTTVEGQLLYNGSPSTGTTIYNNTDWDDYSYYCRFRIEKPVQDENSLDYEAKARWWKEGDVEPGTWFTITPSVGFPFSAYSPRYLTVTQVGPSGSGSSPSTLYVDFIELNTGSCVPSESSSGDTGNSTPPTESTPPVIVPPAEVCPSILQQEIDDANAGDTINITGCTFNGEEVIVNKALTILGGTFIGSGVSASQSSLSMNITANNVIIRNTEFTNTLRAIRISGADNVELDRLNIHDVGRTGIEVYNNAQGFNIHDCDIVDTGQANDGNAEGIYVGTARSSPSWSSPDLTKLGFIHHNYIEPNVASAGIVLQDDTFNITVESNEVTGCSNTAGGAIDIRGHDNYIRFNNSHDNESSGFRFGGTPAGVALNYVENNIANSNTQYGFRCIDGPQKSFFNNSGTGNGIDFSSGCGPPSSWTPGGTIDLPASIDATGATDVTDELLAFFNTVPAQTTILFPPTGTFRVDGQLRFPTERSGFYADGQGCTIFRSVQPADSEMSLWRMNRCTDMKFRRFVLDGAANNPGVYIPLFEWQHAFDILGGSDIDIGECTIRDFIGDAVYISDWSGPGTRITFHDSAVSGMCRVGVAPVGAKTILVERVSFHNTGLVVLDCEPNGSPQSVDGVVFQDNLITGHGVQFFGLGGNGPISNVTVRRNRSEAAWGLFTYGWTPGPRRSNIIFEDNVGLNEVDHGTGASLYFTATDGLHVHRNRVKLVSNQYLVRAVDSTNVNVSGNILTGGLGELQLG